MRRKYEGSVLEVEITPAPQVVLISIKHGVNETLFKKIAFELRYTVEVRLRIYDEAKIIERYEETIEEIVHVAEDSINHIEVDKILSKLNEQYHRTVENIIRFYEAIDDKLEQVLEEGIPIVHIES